MEYTHISETNNIASDYIHFIPYVNCPDLLLKAALSTVNSAKEGRGIIIDNRSDQSVISPLEVIHGTEAEKCFSVAVPDVPLTTAQTMNFMVKISDLNCAKFFTWMHTDGEVAGDCMILVNDVRKRITAGESWGCIFTRYDVYCAFNVAACKAVGDWDWLRFPFYFLDVDYYHRLRKAGYPCIDIGGNYVLHHHSSSTLKNDTVRHEVIAATQAIQAQFIKDKHPDLKR